MKHAYLLVLGALAAGAAPAAADRRAFTRTYEHQTASEAETELELYSTQRRFEDVKAFDLELAIEHGLTTRWDLALFHLFAQPEGGSLTYQELRLRTRYRLAERGDWPIDVAGVLEAARVFGPHAYEIEARAIVARDLGPVTVAINLIGQLGIEDVDGSFETAIVPAWAAGLSYEVLPELKLGVETWGERPLDEDETGEIPIEALVGPAVAWAPASSLWATLTAGFGLTDDSDDYAVRLAIGVAL